MRVFLLSVLMMVGMIGCASAVKESGKSVISSVSENIDNYDLGDDFVGSLAVGEQNHTSAFTYVGLGLFTAGAVMFALFSRDAGIKLIICGALAGSVPYIVQSPYFSIIVSGALLLALLVGIWHLWWKVKRIESEPNTDGEEKKP